MEFLITIVSFFSSLSFVTIFQMWKKKKTLTGYWGLFSSIVVVCLRVNQ